MNVEKASQFQEAVFRSIIDIVQLRVTSLKAGPYVFSSEVLTVFYLSVYVDKLRTSSGFRLQILHFLFHAVIFILFPRIPAVCFYKFCYCSTGF
jgi:hypothetical protein